jgi:hypothetical protein
MADKFDFIISATDKATAVVRKINKEFDNSFRWFTKTGESIKALSNEAGFNQFTHHLSDAATEAGRVAQSIASIAAPLGAVFGLGSIAGLGKVVKDWADMGREVKMTASYTGMSAEEIQKWQGAGRAMGIVTDSMTSSLEGFNQALENAIYGRDQEKLALFNMMGVDIGSRNNVRDATQVLEEFSDKLVKLQKANPRAAYKALELSGMTALAPLLYQGSGKIRELMKTVQQFGYVRDQRSIDNANEMYLAEMKAVTATEGLTRSIADGLTPAITPLLTQYATWIRDNRDLITQRVDVAVRNIGAEIMQVGQALGSGVEAIGGWHNAFKLLELYIVGTFATSVLKTIASINAAFLSTPFGRFAMAGVGYYELYQHSYYPEWFQNAYDWITGNKKSAPGATAGNPRMPSMAVSPAAAGGLPIGSPISALSAPGSDGRLKVDVTFNNAPAGTRVKTTARGDFDAVTRVLQTMPPEVAQ